jgi:hypothetical protein
VLLASTAVPLWSRSRLFLGPIFVATGTATGAAATRLALVACGLPEGHPTRRALGTVETAAMAAELVLSEVNERRLGPELAAGLEHGRPGRQFTAAKWLVRSGLALQLVRSRAGRPAHDVASVQYLIAGLLFRLAWVGAGKASGEDDVAVARNAARTRSARATPAATPVRVSSSGRTTSEGWSTRTGWSRRSRRCGRTPCAARACWPRASSTHVAE